VLNNQAEGTNFVVIGVDSGISVTYTMAGLQFPLSLMLGIVSIQLKDERLDIHSKYVTRPKEVIFEEALKKQSFKLREMVNHLSIHACETESANLPQRRFFDIYEGKMKNLVDVSTSEVPQVSRCYRPGEQALED
jgi:hypothetical protein